MIEEAQAHLAQADHFSPAGYLLDAEIQLFANDCVAAEASAVRAATLTNPGSKTFTSALFLRLEALRGQGRLREAREVLRDAPINDVTNSYFRALRLSVEHLDHVHFYENAILKFGPGKRGYHRAIVNYALLLRDLGRARDGVSLIVDYFVDLSQRRRFGCDKKIRRSSRRDWADRAGTALADLQEALGQKGIEFFLISGTLLGCVRENQLLGHDKDVDIGVFGSVSLDTVRSAVSSSLKMKEREIGSADCLYVRHVNGVMIDIFRHYEEGGKVWHGGIKTRWWNTPFELRQTQFLGHQFAVPSDPDLYLTENYGDWQTPVTLFDTFLDTPNMEVTDEDVLTLYFLLTLCEHYLKGSREMFSRVATACTERINDQVFAYACAAHMTPVETS